MGTSSLFKFLGLIPLVALPAVLAQACSSEAFTTADDVDGTSGETSNVGASGAPDPGVGGADGTTSSAAGAGTGGALAAGAGGESHVAGTTGVGGETTPPVPMPCDRSTWTVSAWSDTNPAAPVADMLDGDLTQGWGPETDQQPGQWIELDLGHVMTLRSLDLLTPAEATAPPSLDVKFDPKPRAMPGTLAPLGGGVQASYEFSAQTLHVAFAPTSARVVRLTLTTALASRWRIYELTGECQ